MKLYTFNSGAGPRLGAETEDGQLLDLDQGFCILHNEPYDAFSSMQALIESQEAGLDVARDVVKQMPGAALHSWDDVKILAPLPNPRKIRDFSCFERHLLQATEGAARMLAHNKSDPAVAYQEMRKKFNLDSLPGPGWYEVPAYYYSDSTTVIGHDEKVVWPHYSNWPDYELELAAVIGKPGRDVTVDAAQQHIFGYTIFNDLSARDAQFVAMSTGLGVAKGKDFDGSNVLGPCIVTADEIPDPYNLTMRARVNGEEWSVSFSGEARWRFADCIAYASQSQWIHAGEIFAAGAAADGCALEHMQKLKRGDVVELYVEPIGVLRTWIV